MHISESRMSAYMRNVSERGASDDVPFFHGLMFRGDRCYEERLTDFTSKSMIPYRFFCLMATGRRLGKNT